ncbi:glycerol-3-phosphate dehydrogenase/oxidase [Cryobacterium sp. BB736]|uniref:glycerol-3-phosphate dehydrogenase/oxidase n=1 Tax=Cryobacterium sp. BB736 TaxID=2746963 RepID=UPI0018757681
MVTDRSRLGAPERAAAIARMRDGELDVLVVGGGVVGAGAALDAATRGLRVGLVEARDWASGTSSRSSKLVHGGIRYLEQLDFSLVREALVERGLLLEKLAPHLVRPVRFLYPLTVPLVERGYIGAGMALYDVMSYTGGRSPGVPHHRHLSRRQVQLAMPGLRTDDIRGGISYFDAQVDDARFVVTLVRTAAQYGAQVANRLRVEGFLKEGDRIVGARVRDYHAGGQFEIRAKRVVNATGVWTDDTEALTGDRSRMRVRASKGVHLVVPKDRFHSTMGVLLRTEKSVLFVIPWGRHWIIGTTDTDWNLDKAHPAATAADIDYLLQRVNRVLAEPLSREDVVGVYAGLRPLLAGESDDTSKLSREHVVESTVPGMVFVAGGKFTTYRVMAMDAIDATGVTAVPSVTADIPLAGAEGFAAAWNVRAALAAEFGIRERRVRHLLHRYGALASEVLELIRGDASLGELLPGTRDYLRAEVVYSARSEGALHLDDVLTRRTRISIEAADRGVAAAPVVARLMGGVLGWDEQRIEREVELYLERVFAERGSQEQPDDASADRVRLSARDSMGLL